jgi:hypothetical protein
VAPVPPPLPADDGTWTLTAPSQSVTTYLIGTSSG